MDPVRWLRPVGLHQTQHGAAGWDDLDAMRGWIHGPQLHVANIVRGDGTGQQAHIATKGGRGCDAVAVRGCGRRTVAMETIYPERVETHRTQRTRHGHPPRRCNRGYRRVGDCASGHLARIERSGCASRLKPAGGRASDTMGPRKYGLCLQRPRTTHGAIVAARRQTRDLMLRPRERAVDAEVGVIIASDTDMVQDFTCVDARGCVRGHVKRTHHHGAVNASRDRRVADCQPNRGPLPGGHLRCVSAREDVVAERVCTQSPRRRCDTTTRLTKGLIRQCSAHPQEDASSHPPEVRCRLTHTDRNGSTDEAVLKVHIGSNRYVLPERVADKRQRLRVGTPRAADWPRRCQLLPHVPPGATR
eukprot:m.964350 g.964350  ORF g.964350 m.964350 type:complete len:360 (-) comp23902_c0_seq18:1980-3059(-)